MNKSFLRYVVIYSCFGVLCSAAAMENQNNDYDGQLYEQYSDGQLELGKQLLKDFDITPKIALKNISVADFGCGTGRLLRYYAATNKKGFFVGFDKSKAMIVVAEKKECEEKVAHIIFRQADISLAEPDFISKKFYHVVICNSVLQWVPKEYQKNVIKNMAYALKEGGECVVRGACETENTRPLLQALFAAVRKNPSLAARVQNNKPACWPLQFDTLRELFTSAGFEVKACQRKNSRMSFDTKEEFATYLQAFLSGVSPFSLLSKQEQTSLLSLALEEYKGIKPLEDGKWVYPFSSFRVHAIKK